MRTLLGGLFIAGAVVLAICVLAPKRKRAEEPPPLPASPKAAETTEGKAPVPKPARNFSIKRTKSEVGYVYWILEGYGRYKCFILCDTWEEAVATAKTRLEEIDGVESEAPVTASALA